MIMALIAGTAGVYGLLMKFVLKNVFVPNPKNTVNATEKGNGTSDLVPAYDR